MFVQNISDCYLVSLILDIHNQYFSYNHEPGLNLCGFILCCFFVSLDQLKSLESLNLPVGLQNCQS